MGRFGRRMQRAARRRPRSQACHELHVVETSPGVFSVSTDWEMVFPEGMTDQEKAEAMDGFAAMIERDYPHLVAQFSHGPAAR